MAEAERQREREREAEIESQRQRQSGRDIWTENYRKIHRKDYRDIDK